MEISIMEKPNTISMDEVAELLHDAHSVNKEKGFELPTAHQNAEELRKRLGNGLIYVAVVDGVLAGCCALILEDCYEGWFYNGACAIQHLTGVKREFQGLGLGKMLDQKRIEEAFKRYPIIIGNTAEQNERRIGLLKKEGYEFVDYVSYPDTNHYSIVYAKWRDGCPNTKKCKRTFRLRRFRCRLVRKSNGEIRDCWKGVYSIYKMFK